MKKLSLVVPCFNEQESIPFFYPAVQKVLITMPEVKPEYWFVDDGSKDGTLSELKKLHEQDQAVHYISFREILVKKRQFMQVYRLQRVTMWH